MNDPGKKNAALKVNVIMAIKSFFAALAILVFNRSSFGYHRGSILLEYMDIFACMRLIVRD